VFACLHAPGNLPLLVECAGYFSPLVEQCVEQWFEQGVEQSVEPAPSDTVVFDIRGLNLIYGTPEQIAVAIERRMGLKANLAIASNPDAAVHAARGIPGVTVIAPGREAATLAPLPLFLLGGSLEFARTLDTWGIRIFGEFAALPPLGIAARLGDEAIAMQRLARGEGNRLLRLSKDPLEFFEEFEPESTLDLLEPVLLLLGRIMNDICARLRRHSLSANEIRLKLKLERAPDHAVTLCLPVPMLDAQVFLKLLQLELDARPPQAPVERIRLDLKPVEPRTTQHGLFLPASPAPEKLEITLARIRALVGAANLGTPELMDTHRPDSFSLVSLGSLQSTTSRKNRAGVDPERVNSGRPAHLCNARPALPVLLAIQKLVMRRFRPPQHAQVWRGADGRPARISFSKADGRVIACAGPWRTSGDWWTGEPWDREEWDIEIAGREITGREITAGAVSGGVLRIHRDCRRGEWFVEGSYD
jgi:protein ImuB